MSGSVPTVLVVLVLAAHFVSDFLLQSDVMAAKKSSSFRWLTAHVAAYGSGLAATTFCVLWSTSLRTWLLWLGVNLALHWLTDAVTSRWTSALYQAGQRHWFFVVIGLDQLVHGVTLVATLAVALN